MNDHRYFECDTVSIWLPNDCKILQPLPMLAAKIGQAMIAIEAMPVENLWDGAQQSMNAPQPQNPQCEFSIIRQGHVDLPYNGHELIEETRSVSTNYIGFKWDSLFEDGDRRAIITVSGTGKFADHEATWAQVVESFQFK